MEWRAPEAQAHAQAAVLATRVHVPPVRPRAIRRERLFVELDRAWQMRCPVVSAPAGFGKTTLLADWAQTHPSRVGWLSLDPANNDPVRFWTHGHRRASARLAGYRQRTVDAAHGTRAWCIRGRGLPSVWIAFAGSWPPGLRLLVLLLLLFHDGCSESAVEKHVSAIFSKLAGGWRTIPT